MSARCPDPQKLAAYAQGELTDPSSDEVAAHVQECQACEATVTNLELKGDTVISALRKRPAADPVLDEPQCQRAVELVREVGRDPATVDLARAGAGGSPTSAATALGQLREYKLLEKLGEGGMGAVYKALHTKLKRIVALKVLPAERLQDPHALARFEREMEAVGKLDHPHIVRAMDAGEYNGTHFLVMEYVEGIDLSQLVKERGPLPIAEACELIRQAAVGLQHAHDHGLVHRDIKPSNLMLTASGERKLPESAAHQATASSKVAAHNQGAHAPRSPMVKILDLGLALLSNKHGESPQRELTGTGQLMGTLDYMAPEQGSDSHVVDIRADIYSLGATLYKLLTGDVIYSGERYKSPVQKMMALATVPAPYVRTRRKDVPEALAGIIGRMLEKDPAKRPATPAEVVALLAPFCVGRISNPSESAALSAAKPPVAKSAPAARAATPPVIIAKPRPVNLPAKPQAARRGLPPVIVVAGVLVALAGFAVALAATVFYFQTDKGTLRVEVQGRETEVRVQGTDIVITAEGEREPIKLKAGEHSLVVTRGDFSFETDKFELKRGEVTTVKVELLDGLVKVVRDGAVIGTKEFGEKALVDRTNLIAAFAADTPTIDKDGVTKKLGGWQIESKGGDRTAHLFEVPKPGIDNCFVVYRARVKIEDVGKRAYLEMWCVFAGDDTAPAGEYFSKGFDNALTGDADWHVLQIPFRLNKGQTPDNIKLNLVIEGGGTAWIKDVEVATAPLSRPFGQLLTKEPISDEHSSTGESTILKSFAADTETVDREGITPEAGGWKIVATGDQSVRLFRLTDPGVDNCLVVYHAKVKTQDVGKVAYLSMIRRMPDDPKQPGVYISEALQSPITGTTDWTTREISFRLEKGQKPDLILLNFTIEGDGTAWIKDVELVKRPLGDNGFSTTPVATPNVDSLGMKFALVPKGKAWLGGSRGTLGTREVEFTNDFYIATHEVTQEQWEQVMGSNPSYFSRAGGGKNDIQDVADADLRQLPVESVAWIDCQEFIQRLNDAGDGWHYRLPTGDEWEYACRGGPHTTKEDSGFSYYLNEPTNKLANDQACFSLSIGRPGPAKVGQYRPNRLGLYDMHGNVWEWCQDARGERDGKTLRAHRGGGWNDADVNSAAGFSGFTGNELYRIRWIGVRLVRVRADEQAPSLAKTAYDRFAKGKWMPAFLTGESFSGAVNATSEGGVITVDDGIARDNAEHAVQCKNVIARAKIRGPGALHVRCNQSGSYVAWFNDDGLVGLNQVVGSKVTVYGQRPFVREKDAFHELALAIVDFRLMVFVDGRRYIDIDDDKIRDPGPIAVQAHQSKAEFKDVEVMSLDGIDVSELLPQRDPLVKHVGMWDTDWTHSVAGKPTVKKKGQMLVAHTGLADFYSATSSTEDGGSSLFVYKYLPETNAIRTWTFFSNGHFEVFDKAIDPVTGDHTVPPRQRGGGIDTGSMHFIDENNLEVRFMLKSPDGKVLAESFGRNKRRDPREAGTRPSMNAAGPAETVPELAVLNPLAGRWDVEMNIKPSKHAPEGMQQTMKDEIHWVLGGRFLMGEGFTADGKLRNVWLWGYDPKTKNYPAIMFQDTGDVPTWDNTWDAKANSFQGAPTGLPEGWTGVSGSRVVDENRHDEWLTIKDARGDVMFDMTATKRREVSPESPDSAPINPKD